MHIPKDSTLTAAFMLLEHAFEKSSDSLSNCDSIFCRILGWLKKEYQRQASAGITREHPMHVRCIDMQRHEIQVTRHWTERLNFFGFVISKL
jgi:hypothetical protein